MAARALNRLATLEQEAAQMRQTVKQALAAKTNSGSKTTHVLPPSSSVSGRSSPAVVFPADDQPQPRLSSTKQTPKTSARNRSDASQQQSREDELLMHEQQHALKVCMTA